MAQSFELNVTAMAHGGDAIGKHQGRTVFVPFAIPGERLRVELVEERKHFIRARLLEVLEPSPVRVTPPCPYFGRCGGCHFQHIAYEAQVQIKGLVVLDQFQRVGKFENPLVFEPLPDVSGWEYRNHARFHITAEGHPGFLAADSQEIIPIKDCPIMHPLLGQLYTSLDLMLPDVEQMELRVGTATGDLMLLLQTYDEEPPSLEVDFPLSIVQVCHDTLPVPLIGLDYITEIVHGREFRISATSFYQVNSAQAERLVEIVLGALELQGHERVLDAYCGVGLFTAFLAEEAAEVVGIELNAASVADAVFNLADAPNVTLIEGQVEDVLPDWEQAFDAVVLDPPRTGLDPVMLDAMLRVSPERIVYVSCDPATLARDARRLVDAGYVLEWVQPVDLFPQTFHIENVALLTR
ncbi:MAG: 23S rRNA (uracil(1939)-C(5))-methyltransferase RlmD [Anaerolineae bacterium]|nr:23S rRNA (uracil(1939)-C(5))-methyltransferase RlmD [Anaerolineae bacterium]